MVEDGAVKVGGSSFVSWCGMMADSLGGSQNSGGENSGLSLCSYNEPRATHVNRYALLVFLINPINCEKV